MKPGELADILTDELRSVAQPERAVQEKAYLKSDLQFLGASFWETQRIVKAFVRGADPLDRDQLVALVEALWAEPVHERRAAAVVLLELHPKMLSPTDLPLLER
ncbi:MAG: DNA alkylation repair protein, partial [Candidatus Limnocylindria bacterium]